MLVIYACFMQPPDGKEKVVASNIIILETILQCFKKVTSVFMLLDLCQVEPTPSFMFYILHRLWDGTPLTPPTLASKSNHEMCWCCQKKKIIIISNIKVLLSAKLEIMIGEIALTSFLVKCPL